MMRLQSESTHTPRVDVPTPVSDETIRWDVEGQYQVYRDSKMLNNKGVMTWIVVVER